jgi:hypothetical protein
MKRKIFYAIMFAVTMGTACNNVQTAEDHKDTVVVEKNTTTTVKENSEPSTSISVGANGASVSTKSTTVTVNKDSLKYKKQ